MSGDPLRLTLGAWTGTLPELLAAVEAGGVDASSLQLAEIIATLRTAGLDLEAAATAFAQLGRMVELKARSLLPTPPPEEEPTAEGDAEAEATRLAERLAAYQVFAEAAAALREFEHRRAEQFGRPARADRSQRPSERTEAGSQASGLPTGPEALERLLAVFAEVWERAQPRTRELRRERFTLAQAVARLRERLSATGGTEFAALFHPDADRLEVVVTFLALLELMRLGEVTVRQEAPFAPVRIGWIGRRSAPTPGSGEAEQERMSRQRRGAVAAGGADGPT